MKVRDRLAALVQDIRKDLSTCRQLESELQKQQILLSRQEGEALSTLGESILDHIDGIQRRADLRSGHLKALGLPTGTDGFRMLASKLPEALQDQLIGDWEKLEKALSRCKALNERNGELLASHRSALATLTGQPLNQYGREPD